MSIGEIQLQKDPVKMKETIAFLKPYIDICCNLIPSHFIVFCKDYLQEQHDNESFEKLKSQIKAIIKKETKEDMPGAITDFLNWLLSCPDHVAEFFLRMLREHTVEQHQHVYRTLCVASVYLPVHLPLLPHLSQLLQRDKASAASLLEHLRDLRLLEPRLVERLKSLVAEAKGNDQGQSAASALLACVYATIAATLAQTADNTNDNEGGDASTHSTTERSIDDIAEELSSSFSLYSNINQSAERLEVPIERRRPDEPVVSWLLRDRGGELGEWVRVLGSVLDRVSADCSGQFARGVDQRRAHDLWARLTALLGNADTESSSGSDGTLTEGAAASIGCAEADAVNPCSSFAKGKEDHLNLFLNDVEVYRTNMDESQWPSDARSLASEDANSQVQTHEDWMKWGAGLETPGVAGSVGVLRQEEVATLKKGNIQLRDYQGELLVEARQGRNVLIWLPTGTGKTYIVLKYAEEHLKADRQHRVAFVVPRVRLARQQYERFQAYLPQYKPHLKCGETSGTAASRQPLSEVLKTCRVVVVTGQSLVEAVEREQVTLDQFSLLVLDECHHTRGGHPLRSLMNQYMQLKFLPGGLNANLARDGKLPQIIGLTASPGVGRARGKNVEEAVIYLKQLLARLDVSYICSVRDKKEDLDKYVNVPKPEYRDCSKREKDILKEHVEKLMYKIESRICNDPEVIKYVKEMEKRCSSGGEGVSVAKALPRILHLDPPVIQRGLEQYTQWLAEADKAVREVEYPGAFYALAAHLDLLKSCQKCLILNDDCDSLGALQLLREDVKELRRDKPNPQTVDVVLFDLFEDHLRAANDQPSLEELCCDRECHNPKLKELEDLLLNAAQPDGRDEACEEIADGAETADPQPSEADDLASVTSSELFHLDQRVRGMIFVRTLDLSKALLSWMKRHPKLKHLRPGRITGVNSGVKNGGMTKSEVTDVMAKFNEGVYKLVICTSAAEEGLDFKACNLVIRYLYEASMISMVQTRGRARDKDSRYCVMGRENTDATSKEQDNVASEKAMQEAVGKIQVACDKDFRTFQAELLKIQNEAWSRRWRKDLQEASIERKQLPEGVYRLRCRRCLAHACTSEEMRKMRRSNHVVIGAAFKSRYTRRLPDPSTGPAKVFDTVIPPVGKIYCRKCGQYWGIMVRCLSDGVEFPVLPIASFMVEDSQSQHFSVEKWKLAFRVSEMSDEDRLRHIDRLETEENMPVCVPGGVNDLWRPQKESSPEIAGRSPLPELGDHSPAVLAISEPFLI